MTKTSSFRITRVVYLPLADVGFEVTPLVYQQSNASQLRLVGTTWPAVNHGRPGADIAAAIAMKALLDSGICKHCASSMRMAPCRSTPTQTCQLAALQPQLQRQQQRFLRAVPGDGGQQEPAATPAPADQDVMSDQSSKLSNIANSVGSQKAFVSEDEWRIMDKKVNKYPSQRVFTAIGSGGDDFRDAMRQAVQEVVGTVHVECVSQRASSGGKYLSVRIGPVWVETADQVVQVFGNMRKDERLKWYM